MKNLNMTPETQLLADLSQQYPNHFLLTWAVYTRAKQLKNGAKPLVSDCTPEMINNRPILVALSELRDGKLLIEKGTLVESNENKKPISA